MATATPTKATAAAPAARAVPAAETAAGLGAPTRREFLYYVWGASMVMLLGQATAGLVWFALPRFKEGTFGGTFRFTNERIPAVANTAPEQEPAGRFWITHFEREGREYVAALYGVCTHLGCLPKWVDTNNRFECPCHGSKYEVDGVYIEGPAPRGLDRFPITLTMTDGTTLPLPGEAADGPVEITGRTVADIQEIAINSGQRIQQAPHG